jgi:acyl carrier protein
MESKMDRSEIFSKVNELMIEIFDEEDLIATDDMTADDVAEWDSANHIRLIVAVEEEFSLRFETNEVTEPETVGELVDLIAKKLTN